MKALLVTLLFACGGAPSLPAPSCPTSPAWSEYCCPSEWAEVRCVDGKLYACDSSMRVTGADGGDVLELNVWSYVEGCTP